MSHKTEIHEPHINAFYKPMVDAVLATAALRGETLRITKGGHKYVTLESSNGTTYILNTATGGCRVNMRRRFNFFNPTRPRQ